MTLTACTSQPQRVATTIIDARRQNEALPLPHRVDETLTIIDAYAIQTRIVKNALRGAQPSGYKAGLTSAATQSRFHASGPVAGVLTGDGMRPPGTTLRLSELRGLTIETEVAFRIGTPVDHQVRDIDELRSHVDAIAPAIELPNLHYQSPSELTAIDLVATNVAAAAYIVGDFAPAAQRDPNAAEPRLVCNGTELNHGSARDALGDQWQAALWLVNTMIEHGWTLRAGQILLTGTLGRMIPATPGECTANYGNWGTIAFSIEP
ncbi:MAG TPA: fumarylacetoacetate hydrolase family protein [Povalibacter sp.]